MSFEFNGETYLDDRMYVLNLGVGTVSQAGKKETRYMLFTYRNTAALPPVRTDNFETKEEAIENIKDAIKIYLETVEELNKDTESLYVEVG